MTAQPYASSERLAFFLPDCQGGGAQRVVLNLIGGIAARGYAVDLVLAQAQGALLGEIASAVRVFDLGARRAVFSLPALVRYLRWRRPRVLLSAVQHINLLAVLARRLSRAPTRLFVSEHSVSSDLRHYAPTRRGRLVPRLGRAYRSADGIIAVSSAVADDLAQAYRLARGRVHVIYNPVITPALRAQAQAPVSHPWFAPGQPPVVLGVGRLSASKGFAALIQAFAQVQARRPARLMILGEGEARPALEALVQTLGLDHAVSLPGFVEAPAAYMRQAALFVLSSASEALPTVLIEALYCGLPIVATACPGGAREILADGKYGRLVPVGDTPALAQAIAQALDEAPPQVGPEAWQCFDLEAVVDRYLDVLLERPA